MSLVDKLSSHSKQAGDQVTCPILSLLSTPRICPVSSPSWKASWYEHARNTMIAISATTARRGFHDRWDMTQPPHRILCPGIKYSGARPRRSYTRDVGPL